MSNEHNDEHDDHGAHDGAHEIDAMPNARLFNLLFSLSALTLVACIAVIQLFNRQVDQITDSRGKAASFKLQEYRDEMAKHAGAWGKVVMMDDDGVPTDKGGAGPHEAERYHMPVAEARRRVLADPKLLTAQPAYRGWVDRDPAKQPQPGAAAGAQPAVIPGARPRPGGAAPGGVQPRAIPGRPAPAPGPGGAAVPAGRPMPTPAPTEGKAPAEPKPAPKPAPAEGKAPAEPKPAAKPTEPEPSPAAPKPANEKPPAGGAAEPPSDSPDAG